MIDYEKEYKIAFEKAKKLKETCDSTAIIGWCEYIFPSLKETEGEKIRKELIDYLKERKSCESYGQYVLRYNRWINWLEKQEASNPYSGVSFEYNGHTWGMCARDNGVEILVDGAIKERVSLDDKPQGKSAFEPINKEEVDNANKLEAKFKIGDWVVYNRTDHSREVMQIYDIRDNRYYFNDNIHFSWSVKECDEKSHLWSIKEAREGDVLATESGWTCIFKALVNEETFASYCFMDSTEWFCGLGSECHTLKEEFVKAYNGKIQPAKKEQRDLFFKRMKESGYVWNAETKVLKNLKSKFNIGDWIVSANGKVNQVISVDADNVDFDGYTLDDGVYFSGTWCNSYHLWTIKDAKEGDVLSYETDEGDLWIMLYWSLYEPYEGHVHYHALLVNDKFTDKGTCCICIDDLKPATIEQHELLFRKMKEEGYQWDKNKKELIKL